MKDKKPNILRKYKNSTSFQDIDITHSIIINDAIKRDYCESLPKPRRLVLEAFADVYAYYDGENDDTLNITVKVGKLDILDIISNLFKIRSKYNVSAECVIEQMDIIKTRGYLQDIFIILNNIPKNYEKLIINDELISSKSTSKAYFEEDKIDNKSTLSICINLLKIDK